MALAVIGAGLGRTGTRSLKQALELIGFGPCFHMAEFFISANADALKTMWERVAYGPAPPDWDEVFEGYQSTVDFPACSYWHALADRYPDAKVILSVRDAESWYTSTQQTIFKPDPDRPLAERTDNWGRMVYRIINQNTFNSDTNGRDHCIAVYNRHNAAVRATIAPERLLVYEVSDGWAPLCAFLDVPMPSEPFPLRNTTEDFKAMVAERKAQAAMAAPQAAGGAGVA